MLKGPRRGLPLSAAGLDEVLDGARSRAGLARCTCHQLRHTCLTRLREQGMALEAVQAQAGHASIESTRIYLHLSNDWLAGEYLAAAEAIDAQSTRSPGSSRREPRARPAGRGAGRRVSLRSAGRRQFAENEVTSPARSFLLRVGREGWSAMSLEQQLAPGS